IERVIKINVRNVCSYHFIFLIIFIFLLPMHVFAEQTENEQLKQLITKAKTINSPSRSDELAERISEAESVLSNQYSTQYDLDYISEQLQDEINYADVKLDIVDDLISINYRNQYDKDIVKQMIIHLQKAPLA